MLKIASFTLIAAFALAAPAFAQSQNDEAIKNDVRAVDKDNAALQADRDQLAQDRAAQTADKNNGSYGSEAVDSVKIGADKASIAGRQTEKDVDTKILKHHKEEVNSDHGDPQTATNP